MTKTTTFRETVRMTEAKPPAAAGKGRELRETTRLKPVARKPAKRVK